MRDELLDDIAQHQAAVAEERSRLERRAELLEQHISAPMDIEKKSQPRRS